MTQPNLAFGEERKRKGRDRVEQNERAVSLHTLRSWAMGRSVMFGSVSIDEVRLQAYLSGVEVHHPNVWGCIFKGKGWTCIGRRKSTRISNHAREVRVWRWDG